MAQQDELYSGALAAEVCDCGGDLGGVVDDGANAPALVGGGENELDDAPAGDGEQMLHVGDREEAVAEPADEDELVVCEGRGAVGGEVLEGDEAGCLWDG